jgi:hypothetical protein
MRISNKNIRISNDKYKVRTLKFLEVGGCCIAHDFKTGLFYCFADFDLETMKLMSISELDEFQKKYGKQIHSITVYYYADDEQIGNITLGINEFFINFDKLINNNTHLVLKFQVNHSKIKSKLMKYYSKLTK